jgi:hypothetical protein
MVSCPLSHEIDISFTCEFQNRCIMCRAEAHQLYAKKPIFDALGIRLFAVLHEHIESEVSRGLSA